MKTLFRTLSLILVIVLAISAFAACNDSKPETTEKTDDAVTTAAGTEKPDDTTAAATDTDEQTEEQTVTEEVTTEEVEQNPDITDLVVKGSTVEISTREELFAFADHMINEDDGYDFSDFTIKLMADIDLDPTLEGGKNWTPMLAASTLMDAIFDGQGHTINGMTIEPEDLIVNGSNGAVYGTGFFGIVNVGLTIKNVNFTNSKMASNQKHCGGVVGSVESANGYLELDNVVVSNLVLNGGIGVEGDTTGISFRVGGLVGANIEGGEVDIHNCTVQNTKLFGFHNISGLIGCSNELKYTIEHNTVKNVELNYSASYSEGYKDPVYSRYFADPFYCVNNFWGEYHTDYDVNENGNTYEDIDSYDIKNDINYANEDGKNADCTPNEDGNFPIVKNSPIRPKDERGY